jgi:hypothetical protein
MTPVVIPWLLEMGIVSWRSLRGIHSVVAKDPKSGNVGISTQSSGVKRPPLPSEFLAVFGAFGIYAVISDSNPRVGQLLAWGTVIATAIIFLPSAITPAPGLSGPGPTGPTNPNPLVNPNAQPGQPGFGVTLPNPSTNYGPAGGQPSQPLGGGGGSFHQL